MRGLVVVVALLVVSGCAGTSDTQVRQGKKGLHVSCSGLTSSWSRCEKRALKACGGEYRVLARSGQDGEDASEYPFGLNPAGYTSRSMIVMCK
jgi:hypothetical protein